METTKLRKFASFARKSLIEQVGTKMKVVLAEGALARRENSAAVEQLEKKIAEIGKQQAIETVAYTWFNRFCALRYMDVNRYTKIGILSPAEGQFLPEILGEAKAGHVDDEIVPAATRKKVLRILDGTDPSDDPQGEAYRLLLVAACNHYHSLMPFLFEQISDYTELLLPDDLLSGSAIPTYTREALLPANCSPEHTEESVEVIGWLYQFYIADKKDDVFAALKQGKKITPENIPAATQLFTPHWIVRYLVENSLGRLWMLNHPESKLAERMDYYIEPNQSEGISQGEDSLEPVCWKPEWREFFPMADGKWRESIWLRPDPDVGFDFEFESAMWYALTIDGNAYAHECWTDRDGPEELRQAWERGEYKNSSFQDLRAHLFQLQRRLHRESNPADHRSEPFWVCYRAVCAAWDREWKDHQDQLTTVPGSETSHEHEAPATAEDFLKIASPEEIKVCDPACGSGHMLTYAFDLLYAIYEEQGYQATEIPALILTNNLYGIEIDDRSGALAAFALQMKAREKYRRFLSPGKIVHPNICVLENIQFDPQELDDYMDKVGRDLFTGGLQGTLNQWEEADNFGSLIRPLVTDVTDALELLRERKMDEDLLLFETHQKVLKALRQADYLSPKYHVVIANPPYMGGKGMNSDLKNFSLKNFEDSKSDLFSMFIERNLDLGVDESLISMITMQNWMYLSSFEKLRKKIVSNRHLASMAHLGARAFDTIGGEVVSTTAFVIKKSASSKCGTYIRAVDGDSEEEKCKLLRDAASGLEKGQVFSVTASEFKKIPGWPISYNAASEVRAAFTRFPAIKETLVPKQGTSTGDDETYVRYWFEISRKDLGIGIRSLDESQESSKKYFPLDKGGEFRKWFGNNEKVLRFDPPAVAELSEMGNHLPSKELYFKRGLTWSKITSGGISVRQDDFGFIFSSVGLKGFPSETVFKPMLGYMNSSLVKLFSRTISPSLSIISGDIEKLPYFAEARDVSADVQRAVEVAKDDWDSIETSWDFCRIGLLAPKCEEEAIELFANRLRNSQLDQVQELRDIERRINQTLAEDYDLAKYVEPCVRIDEVTLFSNAGNRYGSDKSEAELEALLLADTMREFICYAVGCMLGRYSLDKPGLILANQGDTLREYFRLTISDFGLQGEYDDSRLDECLQACTFAPDDDNVIPMLDGDWFTDDISERFKEFLKVTYGTEHYAENLKFLEDAIYPDNTKGRKRKTIRDYFLKDFYNHHIKLYKKRPIYWLFSSPKGTFNALIYMHRYRPDTVSSVLQYLRDFRDKLAHRRDHQQMVADSGGSTKSEQTKALKEVTTIKKQLKELEDYERDTLFPLAQKKIEINLDDGVKHNYPLFGKALKKVTGLS